MLFKEQTTASEFFSLSPPLKGFAHRLDAQIREWGLPELVITDVSRRRDFYHDARFSYHFMDEDGRCHAFDFRSWHYSEENQQRILRWCREQKLPGKLDVLLHDSGRGVHFHVELEPEKPA